MSDCSKHKKEVSGISDMKDLAEKIGDLHYEPLLEFLRELTLKINDDGVKDFNAGRKKLGTELIDCSERLSEAMQHMEAALRISKPFMESNDNHG